MHDLHTIQRLNAEAHAASIKTAQNRGQHVVATYTGLALLRTQVFDDDASAIAAYNAPAEPAEHRVLFAALPPSERVGARDQSEDRAT